MTTNSTIDPTPAEVFDEIAGDGVRAGGAWRRPPEYDGSVGGGVGMSLDVMSGSSALATLDFKTYGTKGLSFTPTSNGNVALRFRDTDSTSSTVYLDNLTITVDNDYAGAAAGSGSLSFAPGETSKLVTYRVNGDYYKEINDNLIVKLSNPQDASGNALSANALVKSQGIGVVEEVDVTRMQAIYSLVDVNLGDSITRAIQVRKTSGGVTVVRDIGFDASGNLDLAALQAFYESSDGGAKTAVYVTRWYDQSGKGRDMVQTDAAKQGVIVKAYGSGAYDFGAKTSIFRRLVASAPSGEAYGAPAPAGSADWPTRPPSTPWPRTGSTARPSRARDWPPK